jgi:hypothetical protein
MAESSYMIYFKIKERVEPQDWKAYYIDKNNFAVSKALCEIKGVLDISGTHEV